MLIHNRTARVFSVGTGYDKDAHTGQATAKEPIVLWPGVNAVDGELWNKIITPILQWHMDQRELVVLEEPKPAKGKSPKGAKLTPMDSNPLPRMSPEAAIKLISQTFRPELLEAWGAKENRRAVSKAIDAQIAAMRQLPTPEDEDELAEL